MSFLSDVVTGFFRSPIRKKLVNRRLLRILGLWIKQYGSFHPLRLPRTLREAITTGGIQKPTSITWIPRSKVHVGEKIGNGECGIVHQAKLQPDGDNMVAIKKLHQNFGDPIKLKHELWQEASVMAKLHRPNIITPHGVASSSTDNFQGIVMECMPWGDLYATLHDDKGEQVLPWESRVTFASQAAMAMEYMHSMGIVHFDLKSSNLLLDVRNPTWPVCKIGDFGNASETWVSCMGKVVWDGWLRRWLDIG